MEQPLAEIEPPRLKTKQYVRDAIDRWRLAHKEEYARKHYEYNKKYREKNKERFSLLASLYNQKRYHKRKCGCNGENCVDFSMMTAQHDEILKRFNEKPAV